MDYHPRPVWTLSGGWTCPECGDFVSNGVVHHCGHHGGLPADGCELCGEMVNYLRLTQDRKYLVCEVCWSEYPSGRLTKDP